MQRTINNIAQYMESLPQEDHNTGKLISDQHLTHQILIPVSILEGQHQTNNSKKSGTTKWEIMPNLYVHLATWA